MEQPKRLFPWPSLLHIAWAGCLWPWAGEGRIQPEDNAAMSRGREIHAALSELYLHGKWAPILKPWQDTEALWEFLEEEGPGGNFYCEFRFSQSLPGGYEFGGRADLVLTSDEAKQATIVDWKTGHGSPGQASECVQLYAYAWLASRFDWAPTAEMVDGSKRHFDRFSISLRWLKEDGSIEETSARITKEELDQFGIELEAIAARLDAGGIEPVPGEHCDRCPARINCPAHNTLLTKAAGGMGIDFDARSILARGIQSDAEARGVYHAINAVKHALPMLEEHLRAYAREYGPIEVNPGVHLMASTQTRRSVLTRRKRLRSFKRSSGPWPINLASTRPRC